MSSWISHRRPINNMNMNINNNNNNNNNNNIIHKKIFNFNEYTQLNSLLKDITFVILKHSRNENDFKMFTNCYYSVKTFYPNNKIVIIDDNSLYDDTNFELINDDIKIISEFKGAGEILPYYYFLKYRWSPKMLFIQDSMIIYRHFKLSELNTDLKYLWDFPTEAHLEFLQDKIIGQLRTINNHEELLQTYYSKNWKGCFGFTSLISLDIIEKIENKYNLFSTFVNKIKIRVDRECLERIFSIILSNEKLIDYNNISMFGDIHKHPLFYKFTYNNNNEYLDFNKYNYDSAVLKMWLLR